MTWQSSSAEASWCRSGPEDAPWTSVLLSLAAAGLGVGSWNPTLSTEGPHQGYTLTKTWILDMVERAFMAKCMIKTWERYVARHGVAEIALVEIRSCSMHIVHHLYMLLLSGMVHCIALTLATSASHCINLVDGSLAIGPKFLCVSNLCRGSKDRGIYVIL